MSAAKKAAPATAKVQRHTMQMSDIAGLAGVSTSTVSRALSCSCLINAETRARIQILARQFNYTINSVATNLRWGVMRTVIVPYERSSKQSFNDPFLHSIVGSLADALTERGYDDMLLSRLDADRLDMAAAMIYGRRVARLILIGQRRHHKQLNEIASRGLRMVVWGARLLQQNYQVVGSDNVRGCKLVAENLLAHGWRRMVFLGDTSLPEVAQRYRGFASVLKKNAVPILPRQCSAMSFLAESVCEAMLDLIRSIRISTRYLPAAICWPWRPSAPCAKVGVACRTMWR